MAGLTLGRFVYGSDHEHAGQHDYFVKPLYFPTSQRKRWPWVVAIVVLLALLASAVRVFAADWATVVKPLAKQVPRLEILNADGEKGVCSGVVLNATQGFLLTAAHCTGPIDAKGVSITVNGRHAEVARVNRLLDLAVIRFSAKDETSMPLAKESPSVGSEIAIVGYLWGDKSLHTQFGRIAAVRNDDGYLVLDGTALPGDSGGAIINATGQLVGMTSAYYKGTAVGLAIPIEKVLDFVEGYLPPVSK